MLSRKYDSVAALQTAGISYEDATALRRISMTLHHWYEMECGQSNEYVSSTIARGHKVDGVFTHDENGNPYYEMHPHNGNPTRYLRIADKERGALKRLADIMSRYPALSHYVQGDPRGASLYILRAGDVPEGKEVDSYYSRGIVVCK